MPLLIRAACYLPFQFFSRSLWKFNYAFHRLEMMKGVRVYVEEEWERGLSERGFSSSSRKIEKLSGKISRFVVIVGASLCKFSRLFCSDYSDHFFDTHYKSLLLLVSTSTPATPQSRYQYQPFISPKWYFSF